MPKFVRKRIKARRRWTINPKTRVEDSARVYKRHKEKGKIRKALRNGIQA